MLNKLMAPEEPKNAKYFQNYKRIEISKCL